MRFLPGLNARGSSHHMLNQSLVMIFPLSAR
jgi:hypothetical protein